MTPTRWVAPIALTAVLAPGCSMSAPSGPVPGPIRGTATAASSPVSASPVPAALVDVPKIRPYVSVGRAKRRLGSVGLVGVRRDPALPPYFYFVRTRPRSGTAVEVGSTVEILTGDG